MKEPRPWQDRPVPRSRCLGARFADRIVWPTLGPDSWRGEFIGVPSFHLDPRSVPVDRRRETDTAGHVTEDREYPRASSVSRKVAATMTPVASSVPAMRLRTGPQTLEPVVAAPVDLDEESGPGHRLTAPPIAGRATGRTAPIPAARRRRRRVERATIASSAATTWARRRSPEAPGRRPGDSAIRARTLGSRRRGEGRPRLPWTRLADRPEGAAPGGARPSARSCRGGRAPPTS